MGSVRVLLLSELSVAPAPEPGPILLAPPRRTGPGGKCARHSIAGPRGSAEESRPKGECALTSLRLPEEGA